MIRGSSPVDKRSVALTLGCRGAGSAGAASGVGAWKAEMDTLRRSCSSASSSACALSRIRRGFEVGPRPCIGPTCRPRWPTSRPGRPSGPEAPTNDQRPRLGAPERNGGNRQLVTRTISGTGTQASLPFFCTHDDQLIVIRKPVHRPTAPTADPADDASTGVDVVAAGAKHTAHSAGHGAGSRGDGPAHETLAWRVVAHSAQTAAASVCLAVRFAALDKTVRVSSRRVRGAPPPLILGEEPRGSISCGRLRSRRGG
jgi:hypothetical protein